MLNDRIKILPAVLTACLLMVIGSDAIAQNASGTPIKKTNGPSQNTATNPGAVTVTGTADPNGVMLAPTGNGGANQGHLYTTPNRSAAAKPEDNKNPCDKVSDPILPKSGAKVETFTDFAVPVEMGLKYERYYSSSAAGGRQWTNNFSYWLDTSCQLTGGNPNTGRCGQFTAYDPDGLTMVFYGLQGTPATFTENGGNGVSTLTHNADGTFTVHDEHALTETYDANGDVLSVKDASGIGWTFSAGRVTHTNGQYMTISSQSTGTLTYNVTVTDPNGDSYLYRYGNELNAVVFPGSPATNFSYKYVGNGALLNEINYNGVPYAFTTYTTNGWANGAYLADNSQSTSIVYGVDTNGYRTATVTNPLGHVTTKVYGSPTGELSSVSNDAVADCGATISAYVYDSYGDISGSTDNNGNNHTYNYAPNGQLRTETEADGTSRARTTDYNWDPNVQLNRLLSVTVEGWSKTVYTYNAQNRLASVAVTNLSGHGTSGQTLTTSYNYTLYANGMAHTLAVTHPSPGNSNTDVYTYDALGNLTSIANGLRQTTTYSNYNGLGEVGRVVGPNGETTDYIYDARGRVSTKTTYPNGNATTWSYTYDGFGLLYTLTAPGGLVTTWNRDPEMRVKTITQNNKDGISTESFGYDANNDVTSHTITRGSVTALSESATYDGLGRLYKKQGAHGELLTYAYDGNGNVLSVTNAAGHVTSYQYDALDRVAAISESGGASVAMPSTAPTLSTPSSNGSGSYTVSWSTVSGATTYTLMRQVNGGSWVTVQSGTGATTWGASGQTNGTYGYQVRACNAAGCGPWSATSTSTVNIPTAPTSAPSLSAPASNADGTYTVIWGAVANTASYNLQEQINGGAWTTVQSSAATSWSTSGRSSGTYGYRAQACNTVGCGTWSATTTVTVTIPAPPSAAPTLSAPFTNNDGSYTVSWSGASGATSYLLQEEINGGSWATIQNTGATSWNASGKSNGSYGYRVQGSNVGGPGPWSGTDTVTVTIPVPLPIDGKSYSVGDNITSGSQGYSAIGFDIVSGTTWEVFSSKPGTNNGHVVMASGAIPSTATTVQYTWTLVGPPSGDIDSGGTLTNGAASSVSVSGNPWSKYTTATVGATVGPTSGSRGRTYQVKVDFYNAAGANVSSSTCTLTAETEGSI